MRKSNMTRIKELHKKHNIWPDYTDFHLSFQYDKKLLDWVFNGYRCTKCGKMFVKDKTVPNHYRNCKEINKLRSYKTVEIDKEAMVLDMNRQTWQPIDFNQKPG